jgi:hypothetical protein
MASLRTQCIIPTKTPLPIMQGAYILCCAVLDGKAQEDKQGRREYRCTADSPHVMSERANMIFSDVSKSAFIVDAFAEDWFKFQELAKEWLNERGARSSITETATMPAYQKIIGMGPAAIAPIIAQLLVEGDQPDQWFWALRAITEANTVKPEDRGNFRKMAQAWIEWAKIEGKI